MLQRAHCGDALHHVATRRRKKLIDTSELDAKAIAAIEERMSAELAQEEWSKTVRQRSRHHCNGQHCSRRYCNRKQCSMRSGCPPSSV
jgi:hypothetical protein